MKKIVYETEMKIIPASCDDCECKLSCWAYERAEDLFSFNEDENARWYLFEHCPLRAEYDYRKCGFCAGWDWIINLDGVKIKAWYCPSCGRLNPDVDEEEEIIPYLAQIN